MVHVYTLKVFWCLQLTNSLNEKKNKVPTVKWGRNYRTKESRLLSQRSWVRYPVWPHTFISPSADSRRAVVVYWRKYLHEVLVNRLGGLSLPRKSMVRLTDCPDMILNVYRGRKTTTQQQQQPGRPTTLISVGQGPTALAVGAGGGCLDIFLSSVISLFFLPLLGDGSI